MNARLVKTMRDAMIEGIYNRMKSDETIFFLSSDMGAPVLDHVRADFPERFINTGIAEQNTVNVAMGLAREGFTVFTLAIAPFYLRAFEQIRINLALTAQHEPINVNMMGVGAGVSYDVSGPTHHCLEDLTVMRALPNLDVISPSDWASAAGFLDHALTVRRPKYIRFDGKPFAPIYDDERPFDLGPGFHQLTGAGEGRVVLVSTGHMTRQALELAQRFDGHVGVIDLYLIKPVDEAALWRALEPFEAIITLEEAFIGKGGLDALVRDLVMANGCVKPTHAFGFKDEYLFKFGSRDFLYKENGCDADSVARVIEGLLGG